LRRFQKDRSDFQATEPHELKELLDEELAQLPARFKEVVILRDLEGYARSEIARKLALPVGTVAGRLNRGRKLLRKRLVQRGVTVAAGGLAATLAQCAAAGHVLPAALIQETFHHAELFLFRHVELVAIPEPSSIALDSLGAVALAGFAFRTRLVRTHRR
jgi:hypothetical protein